VKSQNPTRNPQNLLRGIHGSEVPEEKGKNVPTLDEIHRRTLEIHVKRGAHDCDLDSYLDEWLKAQRELQEKYDQSSDDCAKRS
jgi:hypothetical protein